MSFSKDAQFRINVAKKSFGSDFKNFKELIKEFDNIKEKIDETFVKKFGYNLLKAKFLLDNYLVHHSNEEDTIENNPWKLQNWYKKEDTKSCGVWARRGISAASAFVAITYLKPLGKRGGAYPEKTRGFSCRKTFKKTGANKQ